jgi:hypothetical protein
VSAFNSEPFTVAQVWQRMNETAYKADTSQRAFTPALTESAEELRAVLPDFLAREMGHEGPFKQRLGIALRERVGRRYGDSQIRIERETDDLHRNVARWKVRSGT